MNDPSGLCSEKGGYLQERFGSFVLPSEFAGALSRGMQAHRQGGIDGLVAHFGNNSRYAYDLKDGWIDLQHVAWMANSTKKGSIISATLALNGGTFGELGQGVIGYSTAPFTDRYKRLKSSSFATEDVRSNILGTKIGYLGKIPSMKLRTKDQTERSLGL